ncbi:MAG: HU family DNA-binding protein [Xanthomonadaceae bacterium]|jgi:nucleoid DNA-binding protein|nr:HU family DNA-binding protein [Xanthomonadaceae bacterium]
MAKTTKKASAKKAPAKAAKKVAAKKPAAPAPVKPLKEVLSKSALIKHLSDSTGVVSKDIKAVLGALEDTITGSVSKKGVGVFTLPGLFKAVVVKVPAKPKRKGINPFTKEEVVFAAKPATVKVKLRALTKLKNAAL